MPKLIFLFLCGVTSSFPPKEREGYLPSSTTEPDQYFLFHTNFNCNGWDISHSCSPAGIFLCTLGRKRVGGGRDPRDLGLCFAQPILHTLCVGENVATHPESAWQLWVRFEWFHCFYLIPYSLCSAAGLLHRGCKVLPVHPVSAEGHCC